MLGRTAWERYDAMPLRSTFCGEFAKALVPLDQLAPDAERLVEVLPDSKDEIRPIDDLPDREDDVCSIGIGLNGGEPACQRIARLICEGDELMHKVGVRPGHGPLPYPAVRFYQGRFGSGADSFRPSVIPNPGR